MWQSGFLVFPTKPAIFRLACSSSRPKFDAFVAHLPLPHRGFQSHSVRLHPASATFHKAQTQAAEPMYVKEDKRRGGKKPKHKWLGTWILFSLTAPGGSFWSTWIYTIRLNVSCDIRWWSNHFNVFVSWCYMLLSQPSMSRNVPKRGRERWETVVWWPSRAGVGSSFPLLHLWVLPTYTMGCQWGGGLQAVELSCCLRSDNSL